MKIALAVLSFSICACAEPSSAEGRSTATRSETVKPSANHEPSITAEDLGTFDGSPVIPVAINDHAEIVAYSINLGGSASALYWSHRHGFVRFPGGSESAPSSINDRGQVVGTYIEDGLFHGFVWNAPDGAIVDLGQFIPLDINNHGVIVGSCLEDTSWTPCVLDNGRFELIPVSEFAEKDVRGINDRGVVVGGFRNDAFGLRAFTWSSRGGLHILEPPSGYLETWPANINAINNKGVVFGSVISASSTFPAFWGRDGEVTSISLISNSAQTLNDRSMTIRGAGELWIGENGYQLPVPEPYDETTPRGAHSLNNRGEIIGSISGVDGVTRLLLWTVKP